MRLLARTQHALGLRLERRLEALGLSATKLLVLERLAASPAPVALGQLAAHAGCAKSNITQLIDRLESEGLVVRRPDLADRRAVLATLTPKGHARCDEGLAAQRDVCGELFAELGPEGRGELRGRLESLLRQHA